MTTKQVNIDKTSPELDAFIACANIAYPDWEINGDPGNPITKDHIELINLRTYHGRCGPQRNGDGIRIGLNKHRMQQWTGGKALGLIIHELAHAKHTDHSPSFWWLTTQIYNRIKPHVHKIEDAYNRDINLTDTETYLMHNPRMKTVDGRQETPFYRRRLIAQEFNREDEIEPFEGNRLYNTADTRLRNNDGGTLTRIAPEDLADPDALPCIEDVIDWFEPPRRNQGVSLKRNETVQTNRGGKLRLAGKYFVLDPVRVTETPAGYEFTDDAARYRYATLLYDTWDTDTDEQPPGIRCYVNN